MEFPELSLAPNYESFDPSDASLPMKRKWMNTESPSVDLQLKDPLPLDWEQCLDLESGRMYYLNRKTSRKAWNRPEEQKIDLDLNISICSEKQNNWGSDNQQEMINEQQHSSSSSSMIALVCSNCHLLVILSRTSPSCPNCKYVHSLATSPQARPDSSVSSSYRNLSL
ncbi:uncharacterized protein LOC111374375 [Olea europaea var. sylvestris]|uniref:Ubiquitin-- ligase n=1 Tax=Olea europaea subsp. europaea TaxID=158383 RepID=A0A8S0STM4_OLEEU|nr:uncharacterized protein LOC111374375 [Olea europaea var. sylvestris]CAA2995830.1 Ubiquitin-- ligase [Olea europaea subsp. europaea]